VPLPENVRTYLYDKVDPLQKATFSFINLAAQHSSPAAAPDPDAAGEIRALFRDITVQILNKTISSSDGVTRFMTRANQILSGN
jgi:hypothetical protein